MTSAFGTAAAGALAHLPVARVKNLVRAMEEMKETGYWLVGLDERADKNYTEVDLKGSVGIVLGGEGEGLHEWPCCVEDKNTLVLTNKPGGVTRESQLPPHQPACRDVRLQFLLFAKRTSRE